MNATAQLRRGAVVTLALSALILVGCSSTNSTGGGQTEGDGETANNLEADIAALSVGTVDQFIEMSEVCADDAEEMTVGVVDGYGTNTWSKTVLAEESRAKPRSAPRSRASSSSQDAATSKRRPRASRAWPPRAPTSFW